MLKQNYSLFKKTKQCFVVLILLSILYVGRSIYTFVVDYIYYEGNLNIGDDVWNSIYFNLYIFIMFIFISFEYLSQAGKHNVEECINTMPHSGIIQRGWQMLLLLLADVLLFFMIYLLHIIYCIILHVDSLTYILNMGKTFVIYFLLVNMIAILVGAVLSFISNKKIGYVFMVLFAVAFTFKSIEATDEFGILHSASEFTNIFCGSNSLNLAVFIPTELYFLLKPLYFIAFFVVCFFVVCFIKARRRGFLYGGLASLLCGTICVGLWFLPCYGSYTGYEDGIEDIYGYNSELIAMMSDENENVDFYVTSYDMELDLRKALEADVVMELSDSTLFQYEFLFCKDYEIISVQNESGDELKFSRDGNNLTIFNDAGNLSSIHMVYEGICYNMFYTGKFGSYLQGNFPYYPIVGNGDIYKYGLCELPDEESDFNVTIKSKYQIYSNLDEAGEDTFTGKSNQVTLVSGPYWTEKEINGVDYIYTDVAVDYNPEKNSYLYEGLQNALNGDTAESTTDYSINDKKVLIAPVSVEPIYMFGSDMVIVEGRYSLEKYYANYIETGNWYLPNEEVTNEELRQMLIDDGYSDEEIDELLGEGE